MRRTNLGIAVIILNILCISFSLASTPTAAGEVTWLQESYYIKDVSFVRGVDITHSDGYDNAFLVSYTTNVTLTKSINYIFSQTYALVVQEVVLSNYSGSDAQIEFRSSGNLGSDEATVWHYKENSSGPYYSVSSDNSSADVNAGDPVVSFLFGDETVAQYGKAFSTSNGDDDYYFRINDAPLANTQTRRFLFLGGVGDIDDGDYNRPDKALEVVTELCEPENWPRDILDEFTEEEFGQILNWDMSGVTVPPTISCDTVLLEGPSAACGGSINSVVSFTFGLEYSSEANFEQGSGTLVNSEEICPEEFLLEMDDLTLGTRYYYKCWVTNIFGTSWTEEKSFVADYSTPCSDETPISVSADAIYADRLDLSWEMGLGEYYAVFMKQTSEGIPSPEDNSTYTASLVFGDGAEAGDGWFCVYNGTENQAIVNGLQQTSLYRIMAITYNGVSGYEKYLCESSVQNPINVSTNTTASPIEEPTSIELTSFIATYAEGSVHLAWETESEVNNLGFILYRNGEIISSYISCSDLRGYDLSSEHRSYQFIDEQTVNGCRYHYELSDMDRGGKEELCADAEVNIPTHEISDTQSGSLSSVYPNPFNASFTVPFLLNVSQKVHMGVYDMSGKRVLSVMDGSLEAGEYTFRVDASALSSGLYFLRTSLDKEVYTQKLLLMK